VDVVVTQEKLAGDEIAPEFCVGVPLVYLTPELIYMYREIYKLFCSLFQNFSGI